MSGRSPARSRILAVDAVGLLACVGALFAGYALGIEPVRDTQARIAEQKRLLEEQTTNARQAEDLVRQERAALEAEQKRLDACRVQLRSVHELNQLLERITQMVEDHHLKVQSIDPDTPRHDPEIGNFTLVHIHINGTGSFAGLSGFLHELAERYRDIEVRSLSTVAASEPAPEPAGKAPAKAPPAEEPRPGTEKPADPPAREASFLLELRWFAAPAGPAGAEKRG